MSLIIGIAIGLIGGLGLQWFGIKLDFLEKLLTTPRLAQEIAYEAGFRSGRETGMRDFRHYVEKLNEDLPKIERDFADKFKIGMRIIEERDLSIDFCSGRVVRKGKLYELPKLALRIEYEPIEKYVLIPDKFDLIPTGDAKKDGL